MQPKPVVFTLSGTTDASFTIDDFPRMLQYGAYGVNSRFEIYPITGTLNGETYNFGDVSFFTGKGGFSTQFGGLDFGSSFATSNGVAQLFTGALFAPVFTPGVYQLDAGETLTITAPDGLPSPVSVPEPSAWALMLGGLAMAGGALRRFRLGPGETV